MTYIDVVRTRSAYVCRIELFEIFDRTRDAPRWIVGHHNRMDQRKLRRDAMLGLKHIILINDYNAWCARLLGQSSASGLQGFAFDRSDARHALDSHFASHGIIYMAWCWLHPRVGGYWVVRVGRL